jgi:hypothetical protein
MEYRITRQQVKEVVKRAKKQAWKNYVERLNTDYKDATT